MNVEMKVHVLRTFVTPLLVHMHQKAKNALEMAAKIASVKRPLQASRSSFLFARLSKLFCQK